MDSSMIRWIVLLPLIGAALNGLVVRSRNALVSGTIGTAAALGSFVVAILASRSGATLDECYLWFATGRIKVPFALEITPLTTVMLMVVTGIGSLIHLY